MNEDMHKDLEQEIKDCNVALTIAIEELQHANKRLSEAWANLNLAMLRLDNFLKDNLADADIPL